MEQFTREYGDIDESFYMSAENTFHRALEVTDKYGVQAEFLPEIEKIVHKITVEHEY
ncbi:MAG: hypothetical protein LBG52_08465 [Candidatus Peribacteria bacterium]|jgi:UTP:GlnB (protein PII) uridylyltransferase|nr:hypothetical protein [Candidatus Peribacteria bacterium]